MAVFRSHWRKASPVMRAMATAIHSDHYASAFRAALASCTSARLNAPRTATVVPEPPAPPFTFHFFAAPSPVSTMSTSAVLSTDRQIIVDLADQKINPITAQLLLTRGVLPDDDDEEESDYDDEELNTNTDRHINNTSTNVRYIVKISGFSLNAPYSRELSRRVEEVSKELGQEKVGSDLAPKVVDNLIAAFGAFKYNSTLPGLSVEANGLQVECVFAELNTPEATITRYKNGYVEIQIAEVTIDGDDIDNLLNTLRASLTSDLEESLTSDLPNVGENGEKLGWKEASAAFISLQKKTKAREARERKAAKAGEAGKVQKVVKGAPKKTAGTTAKPLADGDVAAQSASNAPQVGPGTKSFDDKKAGSENDVLWGDLFGEEAPTPQEDDDEMERELQKLLERDDLLGEGDAGEEPFDELTEASNAPEQAVLPASAQHNRRKRGADGETPDPETAFPAKMVKAAHSKTSKKAPPKAMKLALPSKVATEKASEHGIVNTPPNTQPASVTSSADQASSKAEIRYNEKGEKIPRNGDIKKALRFQFDLLKKTEIMAWCKIHGISTHGRKDDIERRIDEFVTEFGDQLDPDYGRVPGAAELKQFSRVQNLVAPSQQRVRLNAPAGIDQNAMPSPAQPAGASWSPQTSANFAQNQQAAAGQVTHAQMKAQALRPQLPAPQHHQAPLQQQEQLAGVAQAPLTTPQLASQAHITPQSSATPPAEAEEATPKASKVQAKVMQPGLPYPLYQRVGQNEWGFSGDKKARTPAALEVFRHCNRFASQPDSYAALNTYNTAELRNFLRSVGCEDVRSATKKAHLNQLVRNWHKSYLKGDAGPIAGIDIEEPVDGAEADAPADAETGETQQRAAAVQTAPVAGTETPPAQSAPAAQPAVVPKASVTGTMPQPTPRKQQAQFPSVEQPSQVMQQEARQRIERGEYAPGDFSLISRASASGFARGVPPNQNFPAPTAETLNRTRDGRINSHQNRPQTSRVRANEQTLAQMQRIASENIITIDDDEGQQPVAPAQAPIADAPRTVLAPRSSGDISMNMPAQDRVASGRITKNARPQKALNERDMARYQAFLRHRGSMQPDRPTIDHGRPQLQAVADGDPSAALASQPSMQQSPHPPQPAFAQSHGNHVPQATGTGAPAHMSAPQHGYTPQSPGIPAANLAYQQESQSQMPSMSASGFVPPPGYHALQQPGQQQHGAPRNQNPGQPYYSHQQVPSAPQYHFTPYEQYRQ
ncbi:hypothetical protein BST61_g10832 [Cercospora zeina]